MKRTRFFWGVLAGLVGGIAAAMILWGSWLLPTLGLLLTKVDLIRGFVVMLVLGAIGGGIYSLFARRLSGKISTTIISGIILGVVFWVIGVLMLIPILLGFPTQLANPLEHWTPLIAFIIYGVITSLIYSRVKLKRAKYRYAYAIVVMAFAIVLTPIMLYAAKNTTSNLLDLPNGYHAEVVAKGFTFPTSIAIKDLDNIYIAEAGYSYGPKTAEARILLIKGNGNVTEVASNFEGPINGLFYKDEYLYVSHRGKITQLNLTTNKRRDLIDNLPSLGDHQNNDLVFGSDGALYFGQGTATNAGVVGDDNFVYAWADRYPDFHDIPSRDFSLTGENYTSLDLSTVNPVDSEITGAFAPFGTTNEKGKIVKGQIPANGAIHRIDIKTGEVSIFADGLRNPYGLAVSPEGDIYATNLGYDDRGSRAVKNSPDWVVKIKKGAWYGWPDYAGLLPLSDEQFASDRGINRNPLIANPPPVEAPVATLPQHYSPMKLAFAPQGFGIDGIFVSIFADGEPLTGNMQMQNPTGVIVVDPSDGSYQWFLKNKHRQKAGRLGDGLKRVIDTKFYDNSLYILDFGLLEFTNMAPNAIPNTGVLWKIVKK
ncbi:MAG: PQQ-dependent sugar dehydrogenase [Bacillota bacterium]